MRFFRLCFFVVVISIPGMVLAAPATGVSGPENLSIACPIKQPSACPSRRSCSGCPECEVCESPSASTSASGSPSSSPSSSPSEACKNYAMNFTSTTVGKNTKVNIDQSDAKELGCFETVVNQALATTTALGAKNWGTYSADKKFSKSQGSKGHVTGGVLTSMIWEHLKQLNGLQGATNFTTNNANELLEDNKKAQQAINCTGEYKGVIPTHGMWQIGGSFSGVWNKLADGCTKGTLFLDEECKFVNAEEVNKRNLCGSIDYYAEIATPISLVWHSEENTKRSTLVNFKLNPYSNQNTWLWKGSEALPLLVYDPGHTGQITSAIQLFGSWTFGGNGFASLLEGSNHGTPWRNGYEALSMMDKDLDGKVSGAELKDLGLWFDKNQDGISQYGEVKKLSDVKVTALYYKADKKQDSSLIATNGYEREEDGKTVIASSIDWSERSLKDDISVLLESMGASTHAKSNLSATSEALSEQSDYAKDIPPEIYGAWSWTLDMPARGSGIFSFNPTDEGIVGTTLSQLGIRGVGGVASQVMFSHFVATISKNSAGQTEIKFTVDGAEGAILTNTASLSEDGSSLIGKTVVIGSRLTESSTYEYSWKAERVQ